MSDDIKKKVCDIAESWIGTPYKYGVKVKGKGVDCARFILSVYQEAGLIPVGFHPPHQHKDWVLGKNVNRNAFSDEILKYGEKVEYDDRQAGDVASFLYNGIESHLGIIVEDDFIIHAKTGEGVKKQKFTLYKNVCGIYRLKEGI